MSRQLWYNKSDQARWEDAKKQVDEDYVKKDVRAWFDKRTKNEALDELFEGVK